MEGNFEYIHGFIHQFVGGSNPDLSPDPPFGHMGDPVRTIFCCKITELLLF
jgi:hypothetical protein